MKILKLEINNRIHYTLNFDTEQRKNANFIIPRGDRRLFSFRNIVGDSVVTITTEKNPLQLPVFYEMGQEDQSPILTVHLREPRRRACRWKKSPTEAKQAILNTEGFFNLTEEDWAKLENSDKLRVKFCYYSSKSEEPITRLISFTFCKREYIFDVVLDFGSEASQMSISSRGGTITTDAITHIFSSLKKRYGAEGDQDSDYVQHCDRPTLYRSIYYIKKDIDNPHSPYPWSPKADQEQIMSLLSKRSDLDTLQKQYIPLPNAKISQFGGVPIPQINVDGALTAIKDYGEDYFYRRAVDSFIYEALRAINSKMGGKKKAVNICILMPNVYPLHTIKEKLYSLCDDIQHMLAEFREIIGFELGYASESDASMLGCFAASQLLAFSAEEGNYLIVDAGKGTLDFSILKYDPGQQKMYKNLCRSGIVGAGNAITYAIMLALIYEFLSIYCPDFDEKKADEQVRQVVFNKILKADLAELNEFLSAVENYKFKYNAGNFQDTQAPDRSENTTNPINDIKISGLTNAINGWKHRIADPKKYISNEILGLVMDTLKKLKQVTNRIQSNRSQAIEIKKVIFTGRGFLMNEFREKFLEGLRSIEPKIEEVEIDLEGHKKDICLYIAGMLSEGRYDVSLEGTPVLLEEDATTSEKSNKSNSNNGEKSYLERILPDSVSTKRKIERIAENVTDLEKEGVRLSSYNNLFNIGGVLYPVPNIPKKYKTRLFYDGEEFILIAGSQEYRFALQRVDLERGHDFESMFPNVLIDSAQDVVLPNNNALDDWEQLITGANNHAPTGNNADTPPDDNADSVQNNDDWDEYEYEDKDKEEVEGGFVENLKITWRQIASVFKKKSSNKSNK